MRANYSQRLHRVLEALDPRATTLDLAPSDLEGFVERLMGSGAGDSPRHWSTVLLGLAKPTGAD